MSKYGRTENDILFDCQEYLLTDGKIPEFATIGNKVFKFIDDYQHYKGKEVTQNFSHDNWKGVGCFLEYRKPLPKNAFKDIPIFGRHTLYGLRIDNVALFFYMRYRTVGKLFIWIYLLAQVFDAIRMRKDRNGVPHTSGLLLNYFVMQTFGFNKTFGFVSKRVNSNFNFGWLSVFITYYTQEDNKRVLKAYKARDKDKWE